MRSPLWLLVLMACGTTPTHPGVLGDCSKQPCTVPHTGAGTGTTPPDAGTEGSTSFDAAMDTGVDTGVDTGIIDTGLDDGEGG